LVGPLPISEPENNHPLLRIAAERKAAGKFKTVPGCLSAGTDLGHLTYLTIRRFARYLMTGNLSTLSIKISLRKITWPPTPQVYFSGG
jgi:hypothetical protein